VTPLPVASRIRDGCSVSIRINASGCGFLRAARQSEALLVEDTGNGAAQMSALAQSPRSGFAPVPANFMSFIIELAHKETSLGTSDRGCPKVFCSILAADRRLQFRSLHAHLKGAVSDEIRRHLTGLLETTPEAAPDEQDCSVCFSSLTRTALRGREGLDPLQPYVFLTDDDDAELVCHGCAQEHLSGQARDGAALETPAGQPCAIPDAEALIGRGSLRQAALARLRRTMPSGGVVGGTRFVVCRKPECRAPVLAAGGARTTHRVECSACGSPLCGGCGEGAHPGYTCTEAAAGGDRGLLVLHATRQFRAHDRNSARPCPGCSELIGRAGGCEHMACRCGAHWCFSCGWPWHGSETAQEVYNHLGAEPFHCRAPETADPWWTESGSVRRDRAARAVRLPRT